MSHSTSRRRLHSTADAEHCTGAGTMRELPAGELYKYPGIRTVNYVRGKGAPALSDNRLVTRKVKPC